MLGLENDECDPVESKMCVTVFQYSVYYLSFSSSKAIPKSLKEIAQEREGTNKHFKVNVLSCHFSENNRGIKRR